MKNIRPESLAFIVVCIALNLGIGAIVAFIKLPFYLDSIGTILSTFILGLPAGIIVGLSSVTLGSIYTPSLWAYALTAISIALCAHIFKKIGYLTKLFPTIFLGLCVGIVAAIVSAPVTAYVWGGISFSGTDAITTFFLATGKNIIDSVVLSGLASDPIDKLFTSLIVLFLVRFIPDYLYRDEKNQ